MPNAPITEALLDIRVELAPQSGLECLQPFCDAVADEYPNSRKRRKFHAQVMFKDSEAPELQAEQKGPDGYILSSKDESRVVQARLDGFTFSVLNCYTDWEGLRDQARALWKTYCSTAKPRTVTRIAARYINRLELPVPTGDLKDWVLTAPEIAPGLPQDLAGLFMRVQIPFENPSGFVHITQKVDPGEYKTHVPFIFDIDAFLPDRFDVQDDTIWDRFEDLREIKNRVFFKSMTEKTLELCR